MAFANSTRHFFLLLTTSALISACSSTTGPTTPGQPPSSTAYRELADRAATGASTSDLGGVELSSNALLDLTGTLTHATGRTAFSDSVYSIEDLNGPDAAGQLTDVSATFVLNLYKTNPGAGPTINDRFPYASYQYVTAFEGGYNTSPTTSVDAIGVYGIVTQTADIPSAGTASYSGQASGSFVNSAYNADLQNGASSVSANFSSGQTSVTLKNFTAIDVITGNVVPSTVFDEVRLVNMGITGNGFAGGTVEFYKNGAAVSASSLFGSGVTGAQGGNFYGYDTSIGAPDEVGGIAFQTGSIGTLKLVFLAD